jgi:hypothetical protein
MKQAERITALIRELALHNSQAHSPKTVDTFGSLFGKLDKASVNPKSVFYGTPNCPVQSVIQRIFVENGDALSL